MTWKYLNIIFPALFISVVNIWVSEELIIKSNFYWSINSNSATRLNVKFPVVFIFRIKKMSSHFINYIDLEMTLVFDPGVKVKVGSQTGGSFNPNYYLNYFPVENIFWPSVAYIVENRKTDLEPTSSWLMSQSTYLNVKISFQETR